MYTGNAALNDGAIQRAIGTMYDKEFNFISSAFFREDLVLKTLRGEIVGCNFKHHINGAVCHEILQRFWNCPELSARGDAVQAYQLGAFHYRKPIDDYFDDVDASRMLLEGMFEDMLNPVDYVIDRLRESFSTIGVTVRQAEYQRRRAGKLTIRSAQPSPHGVILPHEDMAQCKSELQRGFEIQNVSSYKVVGVNICLQNDNRAKLRCWNFRPTDQIRAQLSLSESGYPYPPDVLEDIVSVDVPINVGDVYFFDAGNVHAVFSEPGAEGFRTTISLFLGFIDDSTVVYWT